MTTQMMLAQGLMLLTLLIMITGRTPIYLTAIVGSTIAALAAGFPITGKETVTIAKMINAGLNPVIADMTGILLFIGIMKATGFLDVIVRDIVLIGDKIGGGPGVCSAGGVAAGVIGALTGPAAIRLGVDPNKVAGIQAHAGHIGNLAGFTHPTQVAILATAGIGYGLFNVLGLIASLSIFAFSYVRAVIDMKRRGVKITAADRASIIAEIKAKEYATTSVKAFTPFAILVVGFIIGLPIFLVGVVSALTTMILSATNWKDAEHKMLDGVSLIATPLVATIGFLFMSTVIRQIGLVDTISGLAVMFGVAFVTAFLCQSYAASVAVLVPFLQVVLQTGADPFASAFAAASGAALIQYFLMGGPVAALATVIPVVPGSDLKTANAFQRPSILFGCLVSLVISIILSFF